MPHRDRWIHDRDHPRDRDYPRDRDFERRELRDTDFGQADYSEDFGYDSRERTGYRRSDPEERRLHEESYYDTRDELGRGRDYGDPDRRDVRGGYRDRDFDGRDDRYEGPREGRSFMDQARDFLGVSAYNDRRDDRRYRQGRVIWAVINGRLDHERGLDARDIEVIVDGSEVILNGTVRSREEKRLAEDLADVRGVTHIQNNLRIGRRGFWR